MSDLPDPRARAAALKRDAEGDVALMDPPATPPTPDVERAPRAKTHIRQAEPPTRRPRGPTPAIDSHDAVFADRDVKLIAGEIILPPPVDLLEEDFSMDTIELEAFMNEVVVIYMHPMTDQGQLQIETVTVNGRPQPIQRGAQQAIRRKYVAALANAVQEHYTQTRDPRELDQSQFHAHVGHSYPFQMIRDDNPRGRAWLQNLLQRPS